MLRNSVTLKNQNKDSLTLEIGAKMGFGNFVRQLAD